MDLSLRPGCREYAFASFELVWSFTGSNWTYKISNSRYCINKIPKIIYPSIKLVSPKFNIERFFIDEPAEDKIKELFENSYPLDKDLLLIFPEGITNIGEINQLDNNFNEISSQLTNDSKLILGN